MRKGESVEGDKNGVDVDITLAGNGVRLKNVKSLNTVATVATLMIVAGGFSLIYQQISAHAQDARDTGKAFVEAIKEQTAAVKEQTQAAREQNCLISMPIEMRRQDPDACRRISR